MMRLVIGNKNYSSWSLRPWLLLRQFGLPFEETRLSLDTPEFHERIGRYSPTGRVPALHLGDEVIWDSLAICEVVNERYLAGRGWPEASKARAEARCAAAEMHAGFSALRTQLPMNCRRLPSTPHWDAAARADIDRIEQLWSSLREQHGAGGDFLAGDFGIVDAMYAPVCVRFRAYGVPLGQPATDFVESIYALPAMREWLAAASDEPEQLSATDNIGTLLASN